MAMARRRQMRIHAVDVSRMRRVDFSRIDLERFVQTGELTAPVQESAPLPPRIRYEVERLKRNGKHYVAPEDQLAFDAFRESGSSLPFGQWKQESFDVERN